MIGDTKNSTPRQRIASRMLQAGLLGSVVLGYLVWTAFLAAVTPRAERQQHFSRQAAAWLSGRLDLPESFGLTDLARVGEKMYVISGPAPSLLLLPAVAARGPDFSQTYLRYALTIVNFWLLWRIGQRFGLNRLDRWWVVCSYLFGSVYLTVSLYFVSSYLSQVSATTGLLTALLAYLHARQQNEQAVAMRWWALCGLGVALAGLSRSHLFLAALPFAILALSGTDPWAVRCRRCAAMLAPVVTAAIGLAWFNWARFGNLLEAGYRYMDWGFRGVPLQLFGLEHLPTNLYYLALALPELVWRDGRLAFPYVQPNLWGTSIFLTSPVLLLLAWTRARGTFARAAWLGVMLVALPVLLFFGEGFSQIGYRYALDFLPFLYALLLAGLRRPLTPLTKLLMAASMISNNWLLLAGLYMLHG